jgi:hypothetical protein
MQNFLNQYLKFFDKHFWTIFKFAVCASVVYYGFLAWRRQKRGPWHPLILESEVIFSEHFASEASHKHFWTRIGGVRNCITVKVTFNGVLVRLMVPWRWIWPISFGDTQHYFKTAQVLRIWPRRHWALGKGFEIEYVDDAGHLHQIWIGLRRRNKFLDALRKAGAPAICPKCSYNLAGNESGICPECGCALARLRDDQNFPR